MATAVPGLNFTAVDFETANGFRGSPCAIGLVRIRDGIELDSFYAEMRPPEGYDRFDPNNVAIHGLTAEKLMAAPRFDELFAQVSEFIGPDTLIAHNATFDMEVFEAALEVSGMDSPGLECLCSVRLSRAVYDLPSHALPKAAAEAGFQLRRHHWALEDARAAAAVVVDIAQREQLHQLGALFGRHSIEPAVLEPWTGQRAYESRATRQVRLYGGIFDSRIPGVDPARLPDLMRWQDEGKNLPPNPQADRGHPLHGEQIVFTGNLAIPRTDAKEIAARHGALTSSRVTAGTTVLVIGDGFLLEELDAPDTVPPLQARKAREALARRANGQPIRILTETGFRSMCGDAWPAWAAADSSSSACARV